jgi:hypothetical protein
MDIAAPKSYATERWAHAVVKVVTHAEDTRTVEQWGRLVGASRGTLGTWCRVARVSPRRSLDLARLLRALTVTRGNLLEIHDVMDIVEPRTLQRLLGRAGLIDASHAQDRELREFLRQQPLVTPQKALDVLERILEEQGVFNAPAPMARAAGSRA